MSSPLIPWNAFVNVLFHVSGGMHLSMHYFMYRVECICQCIIPCIMWNAFVNVLFHVSPWPQGFSWGRLYSNSNNQCEAFSWKQHLAEEMHQHGDVTVLSCLYLLAHWVWVVQVDFQKLLLLSMVAIHGSATEFHAKLQSMLMTMWMKPWNLPSEAWF